MATLKTAWTIAAVALLVQPLSLLAPSIVLFPSEGQSAFAAPSTKASTYRPPLRPLAIRRTDSTGSRGCESARNTAKAFLLAPQDHRGETTLARPTLFWYVENARFATVALVEQGVPTPLLEKTLPVTQTGLMRVEMPADAPELKPDREYRLSVTVHCNANRPSNYLAYSQAFIYRVTPSAELTRQVAAAETPLDRARLYAQQGLWYDAIAAYHEASLTNADARDEMLSLLDQVKLGDVADYARKHLQATNLNP